MGRRGKVRREIRTGEWVGDLVTQSNFCSWHSGAIGLRSGYRSRTDTGTQAYSPPKLSISEGLRTPGGEVAPLGRGQTHTTTAAWVEKKKTP